MLAKIKNYWHKIHTKAITFILLTMASPAFASDFGPSMPWDGPLRKVQDALTGTTAHTIIVIMIAATGISYACGEHGSIFRKGAAIVFGGSIAVGAASLYYTLNFSGAMV